MKILVLLFVLFSFLGCATAKKEKIGHLTGKAYDCAKPLDADEYSRECEKNDRIKCLAKLTGVTEKARDLIREGRISIGMNKDQVRCAYGKPVQVNRTELRNGVHEQWVYGAFDTGYIYLYFLDGVLVS